MFLTIILLKNKQLKKEVDLLRLTVFEIRNKLNRQRDLLKKIIIIFFKDSMFFLFVCFF